MSEVVFESVTKRFGDVTAVDALTLDIADREFMVLLGPSGCGKTTALRMIAGLETVTDGRLRIGPTVVNDVEAKDRDIAMVFQSYALYPHMTVRGNIEVPLKARKYTVDGSGPRKLDAGERTEWVDEAARILGLEKLLDRKPGALSGGQRQRVALARAIVRRPEAFLMDEPLSNLDAKLRAQTRVELVQLHQQLQTTFVYVTHDQVEAMTMADRMAVINEGRLQQVGPPQQVYDRPQNLFVARFIGSPPMDIIQGSVSSSDGGEVTVDLGEAGSVGASVPAGAMVLSGRAVTVGIRPEHLAHGTGGLKGVVEVVESLGHERHLFVEVGGHRVVARQSAEDAAPSTGDRVELVVKPEHVHLFDPESTERIN
ncbi:MAG TPA: ATP-binding cassette domain-containing protein [Acidimicrobiales bacterium]|nr:ATP-binding cassette domain-containing protein [Acidimicrobiales bacterium]